ncbi:response regulator transcription factor [Oligoflexus tunisiensis]|uniref:response regulator transcription factor n=1 Tax=Oligoflexus tunisiensis TaxID=708132 RepID=UPI00114CAAE3|nr:response regulator [Oligoflexus tunisiensis]
MMIEGKVRVLLVEDEMDSMDLLQETLLSMDGLAWNFYTAANGREALDILQQTTLDLVLADILMPEMSGLEMLHHMNEAGIWIPCIFTTSLQRRDTGVEAMRLGAFDFIEKPLSRRLMEDPIHKAIYVSRAFQQFKEDHKGTSGSAPNPATLEILKLRAMRFQNHAGEW